MPCYIPLHLIKLPRGVRESLIPFHALTDSDTTSQLDGIGKQRSWKILAKHLELLKDLNKDKYLSDPVNPVTI